MTQSRRITDAGEPTNAEVQFALERRLTLIERAIEGQGTKLDGWIRDHAELHRAEEREFQAHLRDAVGRDKEIESLEGYTPDIKAAHDVKVRLDTIVKLVQFVGVGVLVSLALGIGSVLISLQHASGGTLP